MPGCSNQTNYIRKINKFNSQFFQMYKSIFFERNKIYLISKKEDE